MDNTQTPRDINTGDQENGRAIQAKKRLWALVFGGLFLVGMAMQLLIAMQMNTAAEGGPGILALVAFPVLLFATPLGFVGAYAVFWPVRTEEQFHKRLVLMWIATGVMGLSLLLPYLMG